MEMKAGLHQQMRQTLIITQRLQQALKLLQMPTMELQQALKAELERNPMLEEVDEVEEVQEIDDAKEESGLKDIFLEQLYTFGDRQRDPVEGRDGSRVVGVAYLALVREEQPDGKNEAPHKSMFGRLRDAFQG